MTSSTAKKVTLRTLRRMTKANEPFACLTAYDATTARWLERAGIQVLLVGDTAAEVILGLPSTIHCPLDVLLALTAAVKRGAPNTFVMGDMPFMSYQADNTEAIRNAGRFMTEGYADAVKLEVDGSWAPLVRSLDRAGIPVVAHIGSRPQRAKHDGGYRAAGRTKAQATALLEDAQRLEDAGASMLLVEAVPAEVSAQVVEQSMIPVIGCGAGPACHGQIVVLQDLLGLTDWQPAFAQPVTNAAQVLQDAAATWMRKVTARDLGTHPYTMISPSESPAQTNPSKVPASS
jgi:3-methyl-2-oxobutanoate hydroxymethyltransferase